MQHSSLSPTKLTAIGALLLVLATAGCGSKAESSSGATWSSPDTAPSATDSHAASSPSTGDAAPSASPTLDKSPEPKKTPKPEAPQKTKAPGGGKYAECADGDCKVSFSGSVEFPLRGWTVSAFEENGGVKAKLTKPNGMGAGGAWLAGPGCTFEIRADGSGRLGCDKPQGKPERGGYLVHLLKFDGDTAVIRAIVG
jgi:hypothetical protein